MSGIRKALLNLAGRGLARRGTDGTPKLLLALLRCALTHPCVLHTKGRCRFYDGEMALHIKDHAVSHLMAPRLRNNPAEVAAYSTAEFLTAACADILCFANFPMQSGIIWLRR